MRYFWLLVEQAGDYILKIPIQTSAEWVFCTLHSYSGVIDMGKKVLLTGSDPFGGETVNPSWEAVKRLNGEEAEGVSIAAEQIPTVFHHSAAVLKKRSKSTNPMSSFAQGKQAAGLILRRNASQSTSMMLAFRIMKTGNRSMNPSRQTGLLLTGPRFRSSSL